jgi:elongation factor G
MAVNPIARIRNLGIAAHIDAGKTTVTERVLYYAGLIHRMGTVDDGNTTTDFLPEERERGITIQSAAVTVPWRDATLNIIDTPGHVDFTAEVERCMRVLDGAVIVFCGYGGVEAQSETVWRQADRYGVARIAFVNKLDRAGANFDRVVDDIAERLDAKAVALQFPNGLEERLKGVVDLVGMKELRFDRSGVSADVEELDLTGDLLAEAEARRDAMIESVAGEDDELAHAYLEGEEVSVGVLKAAIRRQTVAGRIQPVLCGAALRNVGVQPLMDAIVDFLPSPRDTRQTVGHHPETETEEVRKHYPDQPLSALIFKTASDEHGELAFVRVYSGKLKENARVLNTRAKRTEKIGRVYTMFADHRKAVKEVIAGGIAAVLGLKFSATGDTLSDPARPIAFERATFPDPVVSMAIEARTSTDHDRLMAALERVSRDDPTFSTWFDEETGQQIMAGMGELHLEVRRHDIENVYHVKAKVGEPRVSYRESLCGSGEAEVVVDTPLGGKPQYAKVQLKVERFPNDEAGHVVFVNGMAEGPAPAEEQGRLPDAFVEIIEQSVSDTATGGVLRGDPLIDVRVTLLGGETHEGESTPAAFGRAASLAFSEACRKAGLLLLEPIMSFEVVCPEEFVGGVLKDLRMRGAEVHEVDVRERVQVVTGKVPLSKMFEYASRLRSLTQGRGAASLEPSEFGEVSRQDYARLVGE